MDEFHDRWVKAYAAGVEDAKVGKYNPHPHLIPSDPRELSVDAYYAGWLNTRISEGFWLRRVIYRIATNVQNLCVYGHR